VRKTPAARPAHMVTQHLQRLDFRERSPSRRLQLACQRRTAACVYPPTRSSIAVRLNSYFSLPDGAERMARRDDRRLPGEPAAGCCTTALSSVACRPARMMTGSDAVAYAVRDAVQGEQVLCIGGFML
jgi:hypothetical protein